MMQRPNFMIVSGNGRNTGKTSFVCDVIRKICKKYTVTAIKVSPHQHDKHIQEPLFEDAGYAIWEEHRQDGVKDSSRMLLSGASRVYYVESTDAYLSNALAHLLPLIPPGNAVICESGGLRKLIEPSLLVLMNEEGREEKKPSYLELLPLADATFTFFGDGFDPEPNIIGFNGTEWILLPLF
ncbi:MAG: hypothetical protein V2I47_00785 [Bacteroidales bacterium]|jgi:hypothetical protein|nr:hypothetical protein [Bacteroidales bacterium]